MTVNTDLPEFPARLLAAITERMLPSGDGPGARETDVLAYLDRAWHERFRPVKRKQMLRGLTFLSDTAQDLYGKPFVDCNPDEQDGTLAKLLEIPHPMIHRFLRSLLALTLQGYLCHPKHGGNRNRLGWAFLGLHHDTPRIPASNYDV